MNTQSKSFTDYPHKLRFLGYEDQYYRAPASDTSTVYKA